MQRPHLIPAGRALALLRLLVGGFLLAAAWGKISLSPLGVSDQWVVDFTQRMTAWLGQHQSGMGAAVVRDLVLPQATLFAIIFTLSQLLLGLLLLVGWFTRPVAILAAGVFGVLGLMATVSSGGRFYLLLLVTALILALGDAGQSWGYDAVRRQKKRE